MSRNDILGLCTQFTLLFHREDEISALVVVSNILVSWHIPAPSQLMLILLASGSLFPAGILEEGSG